MMMDFPTSRWKQLFMLALLTYLMFSLIQDTYDFIEDIYFELEERFRVDVYPNEPGTRYHVLRKSSGDNYVNALIKYAGVEPYYKLRSSPMIHCLNATILFETKHALDISIRDCNETRFEIPDEEPLPPVAFKDYDEQSLDEESTSDHSYNVEILENPFGIKVTRKSSQDTIFHMTSENNFTYSDRYIEFQTVKTSTALFGMGERNFDFRLREGTYTLWARDSLADLENGEPGHNLYSSHPMYLSQEEYGDFHVLFFRNANAMDFTLTDKFCNFKTVGGIIHLKLFLGDKSPEKAVNMYHRYVGGYHLPPFWSFGYHQSQWGVKDLQMAEDIVSNLSFYGIPTDGFWFDLDYLSNYELFAVNETSFHLKQLRRFIRRSGMKIVPIVDCGIAANAVSKHYISMLMGGLYIRNMHGKPLYGWVWPGSVIYPDFMNPKVADYWSNALVEFYEDFQFSGIWLDMNEVTNFCDGECGRTETTDYLLNKYRLLPYVPGKRPLDEKTVSMDSFHHNRMDEYDVHNFYGSYHSKVTAEALRKDLGFPLPFVLTRSTFPGAGRYAAKWSGDIGSTWEFLRLSLPHILSFNLFSIPMIGADICGFYQDTTEYLCSRWIQSATFYPFARNHNHEKAIPQTFWSFSNTLLHTSVKCLRMRYALLKHMYTLFVLQRGIGAIIRPLFFDYTEEQKYLKNDAILNTHFLLGKSMLIAPIVTNSSNYTLIHLPEKNTWYDLVSGKQYAPSQYPYNLFPRKPLFVYNPLNATPPVYLRGGSVITAQDVTIKVKNSRDLSNKFTLLITLEDSPSLVYHSHGYTLTLNNYHDEQVVKDQCTDGENCVYRIESTFDQWNGSLNLKFKNHFPNTNHHETIVIAKIRLYGMPLMLWQRNPDNLYNVRVKKGGEDVKSWSNGYAFVELELTDLHQNIGRVTIDDLHLEVKEPTEFDLFFSLA